VSLINSTTHTSKEN